MTSLLSTASTRNNKHFENLRLPQLWQPELYGDVIMSKEKIDSIIKGELPSLSTTDKDGQSYADKVLCVALDVGESILHSGGEINRVENTIELVCRAYGAKHVEVFTITSLIVAEVRMTDNSYSSQIRRVLQSEIGTDLDMLERLNALSRKICAEKTDPDLAVKMIKDAKKTHKVPRYFPVVGAALATGAFAVFFGGNLVDGIIAAVIGIIITLIDNNKPKFINKMASTVIYSFFGGILSFLFSFIASKIGLLVKVDMVMIGTIMILIPGVSFGYALRDLMFGDTLSGTLKMIQAVLLAAMIALGYSLAILLAGGIGL